MKTAYRHFYLYKGNWSELFTELTDSLETGNERQFNVWEPIDKTKNYCLVIVYGQPLEEFYCYMHGIWKADEKIYQQFFLAHLERFIIHGTDMVIASPQTHALSKTM